MNITLCGLGVKKCQQLTIECLETIRQSDLCLFLSPDADEFVPFLKKNGAQKIENIFHLYQDGDVDQSNYDRIYHHIIQSCQNHKRVVLLLPGHPMVGVSVAQMIKSSEGDDFETVNIQPGISSLDTMLTDLNLDPLEKGSMMLDANRLLLLNLPLSPLMNIFLYHVCSVGTSHTHIHDNSKENRLDQLQQYLLQYYEPNHQLMFLHSSTDLNGNSTLDRFELKNLTNKVHDVHIGVTLVIPGRKITLTDVDQTYLEQLQGVTA